MEEAPGLVLGEGIGLVAGKPVLICDSLCTSCVRFCSSKNHRHVALMMNRMVTSNYQEYPVCCAFTQSCRRRQAHWSIEHSFVHSRAELAEYALQRIYLRLQLRHEI